jgi:uncharacterized protein (DUF362 family)
MSVISHEPVVCIRRLAKPVYDDSAIRGALDGLAESLGWSSAAGGPFGRLIRPGAKVVIKPNLVLHQNEGSGGIDELVTHPTLIRAATEAALRAGAGDVVVGDAPLQSCDFEQMIRSLGLDAWAARLQKADPRFRGVVDFRRTTCVLVNGVRTAAENLQPEDKFVLFDLAGDSLLEPITKPDAFRVSWYDPRLMMRTHRPGRHQYLVAKDIIDADVVINLPKLKTHKKAGVTCALKNLIGINGNKEYLPHHRIGGSSAGGDCYPGDNPLKRALEYMADRQNMTQSYVEGSVWSSVSFVLKKFCVLGGDRLGIEGSWSGNDTIWRTCLDLNRILMYGRTDATLASEQQRRIIHVVDGVIAGQGNGPLSPEPLPIGLMLASTSAAAMDWTSARLLGYDPEKIPIASHAFDSFRWPLTSVPHEDLVIEGDLGSGRVDEILSDPPFRVRHPIGWRDAAATGQRVTASV